jgi:hypothetical protein
VEYDPIPLSAINFVIRSRKLLLVDSTPINNHQISGMQYSTNKIYIKMDYQNVANHHYCRDYDLLSNLVRTKHGLREPPRFSLIHSLYLGFSLRRTHLFLQYFLFFFRLRMFQTFVPHLFSSIQLHQGWQRVSNWSVLLFSSTKSRMFCKKN